MPVITFRTTSPATREIMAAFLNLFFTSNRPRSGHVLRQTTSIFHLLLIHEARTGIASQIKYIQAFQSVTRSEFHILSAVFIDRAIQLHVHERCPLWRPELVEFTFKVRTDHFLPRKTVAHALARIPLRTMVPVDALLTEVDLFHSGRMKQSAL